VGKVATGSAILHYITNFHCHAPRAVDSELAQRTEWHGRLRQVPAGRRRLPSRVQASRRRRPATDADALLLFKVHSTSISKQAQ
jgi:hypothetical protein